MKNIIFKICKKFRNKILTVFDFIIIFVFKKSKKNYNSKKVLIIRIDALGDFIMWLDSAKEYRHIYKKQKICLLCSKINYEIAKQTKYFDTVYAIDMNKFMTSLKYKIKFLIKIREYSFDQLVQVVYSRTFKTDVIVASIKANKKISIDGNNSNINSILKSKTDKIYDHLINTPKSTMMEIKRNAYIIKNLGNKNFISKVPLLPKFYVNNNFNINKSKYFVVFPGGSWEGKRWSIEKFAYVAKYIYDTKGFTCCLCGSENEKDIALEFKKYTGNLDIVDTIGKTSVIEMIELIRDSQLVISNDTSGIHIAAATNVPSICLLGGWHFKRFMPYDVDEKKENIPISVYKYMKCYNCNMKNKTSKCKKNLKQNGKVLCIENISTDMVIRNINKILG